MVVREISPRRSLLHRTRPPTGVAVGPCRVHISPTTQNGQSKVAGMIQSRSFFVGRLSHKGGRRFESMRMEGRKHEA